MVDAFTHGSLNWVDLSTPDVDAAAHFYHGVFGWTIERSPTPRGEYVVAKVGDTEVAGMMAPAEEHGDQPAVWTTFFFVDDIDATAAVATAAGGSVLTAPFAIAPDARVAVVADPTGAMLGLITGPKQQGTYLSNTPGSVCWIEVLTRDPAGAEAFYTEVFGWRADTRRTDGPAYTMFILGDEAVAGLMMMPDEVPAQAPAHWAVYFATADCAATESAVIRLGGRSLHATTTIAGGRFAVMADPQGATFQALEPAG